ncbi:MAG: hypothetical protein JWN62_2218 [Acidimicrobiales bacterium]|nr:hypothetical protein [Acidimicrobiales bacterium]
MKRLVAAALTTLLLGACSSSSTSAKQPEDEFLDTVETACRDASTLIKKIDKTDSSAAADVYSAVSDMSDTLDGLHAPTALKADYDTYTTNIDEQVVELQKISVALPAGDTSAQQDAVAKLATLRGSADTSVNALEIFSCLGVVPPGDFATGGTTVTAPPDTVAVDTTSPPETFPPETFPPDTVAPDTVFTIPQPTDAPTTTIDTNTSTTVLPGDLSVDATAPAGYTWVAYSPPDVSGLYTNPTIGKLVTYYSGAELQSNTDGSTATVYVVKLSSDFTDADIKAYQFWEAVENGTDVTTPGGLTVRQELGAFANTDCAVYTSASRGVTICTYTGYDGLSLMDAYIAANPG